jgi:predicted O-methyltransferase YrrM
MSGETSSFGRADAAQDGSHMNGSTNSVDWVAGDLIALQVLRPLLDGGGYLPWSSGAMRPGGLVTVCNEIVLGGRRRIVELGSGASTVLLARLLREQGDGATLDAIEHDARWAAWVTERLAREGLESVATVTLAPLAPHPLGLDGLPWYAAEPLAAALAGVPVDLLIADGPPAYAPGMGLARYPALPALLPHLAPDAVVVLDDIVRDGESQVLQRWERETAFRFERREAEAIALGRRDPA